MIALRSAAFQAAFYLWLLVGGVLQLSGISPAGFPHDPAAHFLGGLEWPLP